jgi:hypothetical protein
MSNNPAPSARLAAMRLALAQRAGFATIEEHTAHKRAEYAAMCARIDAERAQEAAARRRLAAPAQVGFFLVSTNGTRWFTVTESERRAAVERAAACPGAEILGGVWMQRRADGRVVRMGAAR